ncbi:MAG: transcriptional repressor NrdR [Chitinivibrionales bacterium]|nr:transcriptional repressor NrdR [Chitinivibrionales bacterium]MBD3397154.1 transcriptional repressor NrdR [Chitinivibrionales bacterium]
MKCPFCGFEQDKVVDSRSSKEGRAVRRRRECLECGKRFTTYEYIENFPLTIVKNDQRREPYDRQKLLTGLMAACKKRPISTKKVDSIVDKIETALEKQGKTEVPSSEIGQMVMSELYKLDDVAYVRFASVYRKFKDRGEFVSEVKGLDAKSNGGGGKSLR